MGNCTGYLCQCKDGIKESEFVDSHQQEQNIEKGRGYYNYRMHEEIQMRPSLQSMTATQQLNGDNQKGFYSNSRQNTQQDHYYSNRQENNNQTGHFKYTTLDKNVTSQGTQRGEKVLNPESSSNKNFDKKQYERNMARMRKFLNQDHHIKDFCMQNCQVQKIQPGISYQGQYNQEGKRDGKGIQVWGSNGNRYIGEWKNDMACGYGKIFYDNGEIYEGEWIDDQFSGLGVFLYSDGSVYEGEWFMNYRQGIGKETWADGTVYLGNFVNGIKQGYGELTFSDQTVYEGDFSENEINGKGTYRWPDGKVYIGDWVHNKMHGNGFLKWSDGREYKGQFVNEKRQGYGIFRWKDGKEYRGNWEDGKQHGIGYVRVPQSNKEKMGEWDHGQRIRWIEQEKV